jgi:hypothetical protein
MGGGGERGIAVPTDSAYSLALRPSETLAPFATDAYCSLLFVFCLTFLIFTYSKSFYTSSSHLNMGLPIFVTCLKKLSLPSLFVPFLYSTPSSIIYDAVRCDAFICCYITDRRWRIPFVGNITHRCGVAVYSACIGYSIRTLLNIIS